MHAGEGLTDRLLAVIKPLQPRGSRKSELLAELFYYVGNDKGLVAAAIYTSGPTITDIYSFTRDGKPRKRAVSEAALQ